MGVPSDQLMKMIQSQKDSATPGGLPPPAEGGDVQPRCQGRRVPRRASAAGQARAEALPLRRRGE